MLGGVQCNLSLFQRRNGLPPNKLEDHDEGMNSQHCTKGQADDSTTSAQDVNMCCTFEHNIGIQLDTICCGSGWHTAPNIVLLFFQISWILQGSQDLDSFLQSFPVAQS